MSLVLALGSIPTTPRTAVYITGTWSLCLEKTTGPYPWFVGTDLTGAALIAANDQFTIDVALPRRFGSIKDCVINGTIDVESGAMAGWGCGPGAMMATPVPPTRATR